MWSLLSLNVLILLSCVCTSRKLPRQLTKCDLDSADLDNCLLEAANGLKSDVQNGIVEIGLPSFDPLTVSQLEIHPFRNTFMDYSGNFSNCSLGGLYNYDFQEFHYYPQSLIFNGSVKFDSVSFYCHYVLDGQILTFPLGGNGTLSMILGELETLIDIEIFTDLNMYFLKGPINGTFEVKGEMTKLDNVDYYNPTSVKLNGTIEDGKYNIKGLFNGHKGLEFVTNSLFNQFSKTVAESDGHVFVEYAEKGLRKMIKSVGKRVPYYTLFSSSKSLGNSK